MFISINTFKCLLRNSIQLFIMIIFIARYLLLIKQEVRASACGIQMKGIWGGGAKITSE